MGQASFCMSFIKRTGYHINKTENELEGGNGMQYLAEEVNYHCASSTNFCAEKEVHSFGRQAYLWNYSCICLQVEHKHKVPIEAIASLSFRASSPASRSLLSFPCLPKAFLSPSLLPNPNSKSTLSPFSLSPVS